MKIYRRRKERRRNQVRQGVKEETEAKQVTRYVNMYMYEKKRK